MTEVADVFEVLAWAEEQADGRTFVVYTEFVHDGGHGMIRLLGASLQVSNSGRLRIDGGVAFEHCRVALQAFQRATTSLTFEENIDVSHGPS